MLPIKTSLGLTKAVLGDNVGNLELTSYLFKKRN